MRKKKQTTKYYREGEAQPYAVVTVSLYPPEFSALERLVKVVRKRGMVANRSRAVGYALRVAARCTDMPGNRGKRR